MKNYLDYIDEILVSYTKKFRNPRDLEIWFYNYFLKLMKCFSRNSRNKTLNDGLVLILNLFRTDFNSKIGNYLRNNSPFEKIKCETNLKEELKFILYPKTN